MPEQEKCPRCGQKITQTTGKGRRKVWCSDKCRKLANLDLHALERAGKAPRIVEVEPKNATGTTLRQQLKEQQARASHQRAELAQLQQENSSLKNAKRKAEKRAEKAQTAQAYAEHNRASMLSTLETTKQELADLHQQLLNIQNSDDLVKFYTETVTHIRKMQSARAFR